MATYTFTAADLRTGTVLAELPLTNVSFIKQLNGAGTFTGSLPLADANVQKIDPIGSTLPGRTVVWIDRNGSLMGAALLWTRKYKSLTGILEISGRGLWSYFERRRIRDVLAYLGMDQLAIAQALVNYAQSKPGGNINVNVGIETCGILRDLTYNPWDLKPVAEAVQELAKQQGGFDFAVDTAYVAGIPTASLHLSYPRRGRTQLYTGWVFEYPGNIPDFDWPEDASKTANTLIAQGAGQGSNQVMAAVSQPGQIDAGYPLLEEAVPYKTESDPVALARQANADLAAYAQPVALPTFTVRADADPILGSYVEGDDMRAKITDGRRFATGVDTYYRIYSIEMRPATESLDETVLLTLGVTA